MFFQQQKQHQNDIICITETWLSERRSENIVNLQGLALIKKDRKESAQGGVCVYVKDEIDFCRLEEIETPGQEVL